MSWGIDIWDQYDPVCAHTDHGIEFVKRTVSFVEKLIHTELGYAKELRKVVKQFKKKEDDTTKYTAVRCFSKLVEETNDLAGQRELIAEYWESDVLTPLKALAKDVSAERKTHMMEGAKRLNELKAFMDQLDRTKKAYEKASEEAESAQHALEKADNDQNSTKAKIDKLTTVLRSKENTAEESRNNYILQLETTNGKRRQHYNTEMPNVFQNLQDMNEKRMEQYSNLINQCAESHRRVFPVINTCLENVTAASAAIDPKLDNQTFLEGVKTGYSIPGDVEFEEYTGKSGKGRSKGRKARVEPQPDYSHLPPEQRRKKLNSKIDELEGAIAKTHADKKAMEKMHTVYTDNPKLGDAQAVTQSLEQSELNIQKLNTEKEKFQAWLKDAQESKLSVASADRGGASPRFSPKAKKKNATAAPTPPPSSISKDRQESFSEEEDENEENKGPTQEGLVIYEFSGQNEDELSVQANDKVAVLENLGDGWLRVRKGQEEGYIPQSYVNFL